MAYGVLFEKVATSKAFKNKTHLISPDISHNTFGIEIPLLAIQKMKKLPSLNLRDIELLCYLKFTRSAYKQKFMAGQSIALENKSHPIELNLLTPV